MVVVPRKYAIAAAGGMIEFRSGILDVDSLVAEFPSLLRRVLDLPLDRLAITRRNGKLFRNNRYGVRRACGVDGHFHFMRHRILLQVIVGTDLASGRRLRTRVRTLPLCPERVKGTV